MVWNPRARRLGCIRRRIPGAAAVLQQQLAIDYSYRAIIWSHMDFRQLRYFVAVADEQHFSRAAARLHLAQSALSSQVRQLELEIGGPLLIRTTRRVELTPAGRALFSDGRDILAATEAALARARALARGEQGELVIGSLGPAPGGMLAALLAQFGVRHPRVRVEVRAFDFNDTIRGLTDRHADVAFLHGPLNEPDLVIRTLLREPRVVVLSSAHRLAKRSKLRPADLSGETFVTQSESTPERWRDFWMLADELGGRPPVSPHLSRNIEEWLHLIGRGEGVDTAPSIISRYYSWPDVTFVPLIEAANATLLLARHRDTTNPLVQDFINLAVTVAAAVAKADPSYQSPD